jgi:hypothetical protein
MKFKSIFCFLFLLMTIGCFSFSHAQDAGAEVQPEEEDIFKSTEIEPEEPEVESTEPLLEIEMPTSRAGAGIVMFSYFAGYMVFYDFKLNAQSKSLIHSSLTSDFTTASGEGSELNINRTLLNVNYRIPFSFLENSFGGLGIGYGQSQITYTNTNTSKSYSASGGGLFAIGSVGWEKFWKWLDTRHIFLNLAFNLGSYLTYEDDYDETKVSNETNHRDIVTTGWNDSQQIVHFSVSFGGTF